MIVLFFLTGCVSTTPPPPSAQEFSSPTGDSAEDETADGAGEADEDTAGETAEDTAGDTAGDTTGDTESLETDSGSTSDCEPDPAYEVTWDNWGDSFFQTWCRACHSETTPERFGAPKDLDFDTLAQVRENAELLRWSVLDEARMPLGGGLFDDQAYLLDLFLCSLE